MLDRTSSNIPALPRQALVPTKTHHPNPRARVRDAALWVENGVIVRPTIEMSAKAHQVSVADVMAEICKIRVDAAGIKPVSAIDVAWGAMDQGERDGFVRRHLPVIWAAIERGTSPTA